MEVTMLKLHITVYKLQSCRTRPDIITDTASLNPFSLCKGECNKAPVAFPPVRGRRSGYKSPPVFHSPSSFHSTASGCLHWAGYFGFLFLKDYITKTAATDVHFLIVLPCDMLLWSVAVLGSRGHST